MSLTNSLPENANKLSPKSITVARITLAIVCSIIFIALSGFALVKADWLPVLIGLGISLFIFILGFIWIQKRYQYSRWWYEQEGLYIQKGVIWRRRIFVPQNRVQHTDVSQGPLQRKYNLAQLKVNTAGTKDASVELSGIELGIANNLRNQLIDEEQSDAV